MPDGRRSAARRYAAIRAGFITEAGGNLTPSELSLIDTAAMLALRVEQMTADMIKGLPIDNGELVRIAGASRRALGQIVSRAKPVTAESLAQHMARLAAEQAEHDDEGEDGEES
jgi:hypothetical protein